MDANSPCDVNASQMKWYLQLQEKPHFVAAAGAVDVADAVVVGFEGENEGLQIGIVVVESHGVGVVKAENDRGIEKDFAFGGEIE